MRPKHFIDTNIILESIIGKKTDLKKLCKHHLSQIANNQYDGFISTVVLGEYSKKVLEKPINERNLLWDFLSKIVNGAKITILHPNRKTIEILSKILEEKERIDFPDYLNLAIAKAYNLDSFITLDMKIINSKKLQHILRMKLTSPV